MPPLRLVPPSKGLPSARELAQIKGASHLPSSGAPLAVHAPWQRTTGLQPVLDRWLESRIVKPCLAADATLASRGASMAPFPAGLAEPIVEALRARGIEELYAHQAEAFAIAQAARVTARVTACTAGEAGPRGYVVATPTASGKSFCFHLPVLQALHEDRDARALYLFPTKALARDQEAGLRELLKAAGLGSGAVVYDGDTPGDARRAARERSGVVITNPDMLHTGILPHHASWARTFQNLRFVVVDEMHMYKGVFGSHVANVLRRLLRVAAFHGSRPVVVGATATIGNPREHAARLFGVGEEQLALLDESGAPQGERRFFLFNPPVVNEELGIRASYVKQAVMLAKDLVRARVPTLVFGHSRNNVEVMLRYLREAVVRDPVPADEIMAYRGGYLPETRREIERRLRAGEIRAVIATNALELGIDIGALDAVICAGYPGSVAALWQRFGRGGRRGETSACILVASSAPVDQYLARDPEFLLGAPVEEARIDPDNVEILVQHLKCAAFELPFKRAEPFGSLPATETSDALDFLASHHVLHEAKGTYHWAADAYPANQVSLRSVGWDNVVIVEAGAPGTLDPRRGESPAGRVLAEMDWRGAHTMLHEQAIYQHDGETYQVERFDHENHKAYVRHVEPDYFTDAMTYTRVSVLEESEVGGVGGGRGVPVAARGPDVTAPVPNEPCAPRAVWPAGWGEVAVVEKVVGYKKIKFFTHENAGYGDVRLPEMQMHTAAFWLTVPEEVVLGVAAGRAAVIDALRGVGKAMETVATLLLMCDPRDLGTTLGDTDVETAAEPAEDESGAPGEARMVRRSAPPMRASGGPRAGYLPTLFLYEHVPGGTGLSERIFVHREEIARRARTLVASCPCAQGCPACVGPGDGITSPSRKSVALVLFATFIAELTEGGAV